MFIGIMCETQWSKGQRKFNVFGNMKINGVNNPSSQLQAQKKVKKKHVLCK